MISTTVLVERIKCALGSDYIESLTTDRDEVTLEVKAQDWPHVASSLHDDPELVFHQLIDLCGVDYLQYGQDEWESSQATAEGFSRGVEVDGRNHAKWAPSKRFAAVCHLLSIQHNVRLRVRIFAQDDDAPRIPSCIDTWSCADWYEREAFDLFGILFEQHPDLRRILTDYGFMGYPFRKDFPVEGQVEMRFDKASGRCVYEPVSIEPRTLVPRVIRDDQRYADVNNTTGQGK